MKIQRVVQKIDPIPFTPEGLAEIKKEQADLLVQRVDAIGHLQKSRELGDLKENGYYQASRQKVNFIDSRLRRITFLLKYAVVSAVSNTGKVQIGSLVTIKEKDREFTYRVVGGEESNPSEGKISHKSPLGRALLGKEENDTVVFTTPGGETTYLVTSIK